MLFSSEIFLFFYLPVLLLVYYLFPNRFKNYILLGGSIVFYSWGAPKFIFVVLGTTILDFILVQSMYNQNNKKRKKFFLLASICLNTGILFWFKYSNFFVENLNHFFISLGVEQLNWIEVVLPIGISFYTFETVTYVVDVYRGIHKPQKNFAEYLLYILFFPKLIAGPIIRYHEFAPQIQERFKKEVSLTYGIFRFSLGLAKKIIIANQLGVIADMYFSQPIESLDSLSAWIGIIAYTFQIYIDFSGYSDMAIGLAAMFGFDIAENFNFPYVSRSITEFWRRWHISLGNWMKNYLYIPLGGNRLGSNYLLYRNLMIVFLISGFWHGASWNFLFWGFYHGFFLIIERLFLKRFLESLPTIVGIMYTFIVVLIGWVFFRTEDFNYSLRFIQKMFSFQFEIQVLPDIEFWFSLTISFVLSIFFAKWNFFQTVVQSLSSPRSNSFISLSASFILLLLSTSWIISQGFNPFIYFRF